MERSPDQVRRVVRLYRASDLAAIERMHKEQGFSYELPDLESPLMLVKAVLEENGRIEAAAFLRMTAETYYLQNANGRKRDRCRRLLIMHDAVSGAAYESGLEDVHAWLPPPVGERFGSLLTERLGWKHEGWASYSRQLYPKQGEVH